MNSYLFLLVFKELNTLYFDHIYIFLNPSQIHPTFLLTWLYAIKKQTNKNKKPWSSI